MARSERLICDSAELINGGKGVRFMAPYREREVAAFAIRHQDQARAYINMCAHRPYELDYPENEFFDTSGLYLVCSVHGATYRPDNGHCVMGPCYEDERLIALNVEERDGKIFLILDDTANG